MGLWGALRQTCLREDIDTGEPVRQIDASSNRGGRTSAVRDCMLQYAGPPRSRRATCPQATAAQHPPCGLRRRPVTPWVFRATTSGVAGLSTIRGKTALIFLYRNT